MRRRPNRTLFPLPHIFLVATALLTLLAPARGQDSTGAAARVSAPVSPFTVHVASGHPEPVFNNTAEVFYEQNAFGVVELGFRGVAGVQLEPTSAFRHHSLSNISRGDVFFVQCIDSSMYRGEVTSLRSGEIELSFKPYSADQFVVTGRNEKGGLPRTFTVFAGAAFPNDWLGTARYSDPRSGFATTGISVGVEYMHGLAEHWQVGGLGMFSHLPVDESKLYAEVYKYEPDATVTSNAWDLIWLMGEGGYTTHVLPVMTLYFHGMIGVMGGYAPEITQTTTSGNAKTLKSGSTFTYSYGAAIGITESDRINLSVRFMGAQGNYTKINNVSRFATNTIQFMAGYIF